MSPDELFSDEWLARQFGGMFGFPFAGPGRPAPRGGRQFEPVLDTQAELFLAPEEARYGGGVEFTLSVAERCEGCQGDKRGAACQVCSGSGVVRRPRRFAVQLPPGVRDGALIRLRRQGTQGDLHLRIRVRPCW